MALWRALKALLKVLAVVAVIAGGVFAYKRYGPSSAKVEQPLGTVERGDLVVKVTIAGGIMPRRHALIAPQYNGYVQKLYVKIGERVLAGAPLVSVAQAVGAVQEEVFPLRSPLAGTVVQIWKKEGEYVSATPGSGTSSQTDASLVRVDDVSKFNVEASVPEVEIDKLRVGLNAVIRAVAVPQRTYRGRISEISLAAKEQQGFDRSRVEFPVTIAVLDPDEALRSGMSAVMDIIVREARGVLILPHEFVQRGANGYFVTSADGRRLPVEIGLENDEAFEIKKGVEASMKVRQVDFLAAGGEP